MNAAPPVAGLVLAGGRSSRMGGQDKAFATLGGVPLVTRAAARLRPQVSALAVSTNTADGYPPLDAPLLADTVPGFQGPLAGILAGLLWARGAVPAATHLATVAVDTPFFPLDLVARLAKACAGGVAVAASGGREHPTFALVPVALADDLARHLAADGSRRLAAWLGAHAPAIVDFPADAGGDPFFNVNMPADLRHAEERLGCAHAGHGES
ncbi:MAG: molybdenum cofactor guanylyltransferase MobA [Rhizobiales bacterium]|nr:molybdenum cofactor guanylyltransferase MobA [Hyphomicrobiales bacterium]